MRYIISFKDGNHKIVSQRIGEQILERFEDGKNIIVNDEFYNITTVSSVKKISRANYPVDFVIEHEQRELSDPEERLYLQERGMLPQLDSPPEDARS